MVEARQVGLIDRLPRLATIQAAGAAPFARYFAGGWADQEYLPEARRYYEPTDRGYEAEIRKRLEERRRRRGDAGVKPPDAGG